MTFIYFLLPIFIWNEIFYLLNKPRLDKRIKEKNSISKIDSFFYFTRITFWLIIILGLFSDMKILFTILLLSRLIQIPLYHINRKVFIYYDNFLPLISSLIMFLIILFRIIG